MTTEDLPLSPRLHALQHELAVAKGAALEAFWKEVGARGTPVVEPLAGDDQRALVTFLWRAAEPVDNVVVVGGPAGFDFAGNQMAQLPGTDLWYKTYRARTDLRTTYRLSPNDPLVPLARVTDWQARAATWQLDLLNRRPFPAEQPSTSSFALPAAPPQPWITPRPGAPVGEIHQRQLHSDILGNDRTVWIYTPPGYTSDGAPCGLLLLFDGWAHTHIAPTPTILDNLLAEGLLPPLVAVMLGNAEGGRTRELSCYPPFTDFLTQELLPWARRSYHLTTDPARTVVAGASLGGLAAALAALRHPEVFGNVLSQSGSFYWGPETGPFYWGPNDGVEFEWLPRQFVISPRLPLRFYLEVGLLERDPRGVNGPSMVLANRHFRDVLQAKGYAVHYAEFNGGHECLCWQGTLDDGLLFLMGNGVEARHR